MSQKVERPTLSGHKIKTRKRDEKEKRDPIGFRDSIILGLNEAGTNLEAVSAFLDKSGSSLNYRLYADSLIHILLAGGLLAPGGGLIEDQQDSSKGYRSDVCVFLANDDEESLQAYCEVFHKLIRRYRYLEKIFEDEMTARIIPCMKGYTEEERCKLAKITALWMTNGQLSARCLKGLFEDHLVKDDMALRFATVLFKTWLAKNSIKEIKKALQNAGIEGKLMLLFPIHKRNEDNFNRHFTEAGLAPLVEYQRRYLVDVMKKKVENDAKEMIGDDDPAPVKEIIATVKESMKAANLTEADVIVNLWTAVMDNTQWNKKEELIAEQALRHLKVYAPLLKAFTETPKSELLLICRIQDFCYENMNFMKVFHKIVMLFYKADVLSENVIILWYKEKNTPKGRTIFLEQLKKFVEWLEHAEEESEEEEEEEEEEK